MERRRRVLRRRGDVDDVEHSRPEADDHGSLLKVFAALYVFVGIGILVEIARRLGMGFIGARAELEAESRAEAVPGSRDAS